jgi:folate/biopterin transporter
MGDRASSGSLGGTDRPLSADALRLLDRARRESVQGLPCPRGQDRASARFSHVHRWTQPQPKPDLHLEERGRVPLLSGTREHAVGEASTERATRDPFASVAEMVRASTTLSSVTRDILADRKVTLVIFCAGWILMVQGLSSFHGLAFSYFMKDDLKVSPATLTSISSISALPWVVKPLYGFCSDALPVFGYRRKPYLLASGVAGFLSWLCMAELVDSVWSAVIFGGLLPSLAMAFANVLAEALVVERSRGESQEYAGRLQTCIYGAKEVGAISASFLGGWVLSFMTARDVFLLASLIPLSLVVVAVVVAEDRVEGESVSCGEVQGNMRKLYRTFCHPRIWKPVAFLFFFNVTPSAGATWFFFYTDVVHFSSTFLGTMNLVGSLCSLVGVLLFDATLRSIPFYPIFVWGTIVGTAIGCTQIFFILRWNLDWGIPDEMFALGEASVQALIGWVCSMPLFILAARLCPKGMESTMYATIMSFLNFGGLIGGQMGAGIIWMMGITEDKLDNFWLLVLVCNLSSLLPLLLLLPSVGFVTAEDVNGTDDIDEVLHPELDAEAHSGRRSRRDSGDKFSWR